MILLLYERRRKLWTVCCGSDEFCGVYGYLNLYENVVGGFDWVRWFGGDFLSSCYLLQKSEKAWIWDNYGPDQSRGGLFFFDVAGVGIG